MNLATEMREELRALRSKLSMYNKRRIHLRTVYRRKQKEYQNAIDSTNRVLAKALKLRNALQSFNRNFTDYTNFSLLDKGKNTRFLPTRFAYKYLLEKGFKGSEIGLYFGVDGHKVIYARTVVTQSFKTNRDNWLEWKKFKYYMDQNSKK